MYKEETNYADLENFMPKTGIIGKNIICRNKLL